MGVRGRKIESSTKRIKLPYILPLYIREMIVKIAEKENVPHTRALIDMIDEEHQRKFSIKGDEIQ